MRKIVCALVGCFLIWGCSQVTRHRLMRFFFEIPDDSRPQTASPDRPGSTGGPRVFSLPAPRVTSLHPPFLERRCRNCHNASRRMNVRENFLDVCRTCHERYFSDEVGHPPVSLGQCTECHNMHRSDQPRLLKMPVFDLCIECHDEPEDLSEEAHDAPDVERCIACHDPHFGAAKLLKPGRGAARSP